MNSEKPNPTNLRLSLIRLYSTSKRFGRAKRQPEAATRSGNQKRKKEKKAGEQANGEWTKADELRSGEAVEL
ncbi:MAG: hypothetical protein ACLQVJ_12485 [Syntrophobacteraceae bacterium]